MIETLPSALAFHRMSAACVHGFRAFLCTAVWLAFNGSRWGLYLPYVAAAVTLVIAIGHMKSDALSAHGTDRIIIFGPMFLAVPMAVFGTDHFVFRDTVAAIMPSWIPWHLFWVFLVGTCLLAGALSLAMRRYAPLSAALFGTMLFLFVLLMHIPAILKTPGDRFNWAIAARDLTFGTGAISFAATQAPLRWSGLRNGVLTLIRLLIGVAVIFFAVEHFLHPEFKPGVPLRQLTPLWVPARMSFSYFTGAILLLSGVGLISNRRIVLAATGLGLLLALLTLVLYVPIVIAQPLAIGSGLNYLANTLLFSGSVLCFAASQRQRLITAHPQGSA